MTRPFSDAKPSSCDLLECRNGQVWNAGIGAVPCPFCHPDAVPGKAA